MNLGDSQDFLCFGERIEGFLVLAFFVQLFAFGAQFFHLVHLRRGDLCIRNRFVNLFHFLRAVKRERRGCDKHDPDDCQCQLLHGLLPYWMYSGRRLLQRRQTRAAFSHPVSSTPLAASLETCRLLLYTSYRQVVPRPYTTAERQYLRTYLFLWGFQTLPNAPFLSSRTVLLGNRITL